jgi:hypothetical protein
MSGNGEELKMKNQKSMSIQMLDVYIADTETLNEKINACC